MMNWNGLDVSKEVSKSNEVKHGCITIYVEIYAQSLSSVIIMCHNISQFRFNLSGIRIVSMYLPAMVIWRQHTTLLQPFSSPILDRHQYFYLHNFWRRSMCPASWYSALSYHASTCRSPLSPAHIPKNNHVWVLLLFYSAGSGSIG